MALSECSGAAPCGFAAENPVVLAVRIFNLPQLVDALCTLG